MAIDEGSSSSVVQETHKTELAIATPSEDPEFDDVVSVPGSLLQNNHLIKDEKLPFDIEVVRYFPNSGLFPTAGGKEGPRATAGGGLNFVAVPEPEVSGTDKDQPMNVALRLPDFQDQARSGTGHLAGHSASAANAAGAF